MHLLLPQGHHLDQHARENHTLWFRKPSHTPQKISSKVQMCKFQGRSVLAILPVGRNERQQCLAEYWSNKATTPNPNSISKVKLKRKSTSSNRECTFGSDLKTNCIVKCSVCWKKEHLKETKFNTETAKPGREMSCQGTRPLIPERKSHLWLLFFFPWRLMRCRRTRRYKEGRSDQSLGSVHKVLTSRCGMRASLLDWIPFTRGKKGRVSHTLWKEMEPRVLFTSIGDLTSHSHLSNIYIYSSDIGKRGEIRKTLIPQCDNDHLLCSFSKLEAKSFQIEGTLDDRRVPVLKAYTRWSDCDIRAS